MERSVCTNFPKKFQWLYRPVSGLVVVGIIFTITLTLTSHVLFGIEMRAYKNSTVCSFSSRVYANFYINVFTKINTAIYLVVPAIIIILSNVTMLYRLFTSRRAVAPVPSHQNSSVLQKSRRRQVLLVTVMISAAFILLLAPKSIANMLYETQLKTTETYLQLEFIFYIMAYCNYAINFFLFVLSGSRFRNNLKLVFCKGAIINSTEVLS